MKALATAVLNDAAYDELELTVRDRSAAAETLFTTDAAPDALWNAYLLNLPEERRQHYTCHACRSFVQRYGGLVTIDVDGTAVPLLWTEAEGLFADSVAALAAKVKKAKVTGMFLSSLPVWGTPQTGEWSHLSGAPARTWKGRVQSAGQAMAGKREDYAILSRGLAEYPVDAVRQAVRVLKADALSRSEKTLGVAEWLLSVHESVSGKRGTKRNNLVWRAVADAPAGYCHVRSTMISTLLDDIVAGLDFAAISARWAEKMHPLRYQRPQAPPKSGTIAQAEKLVAELGIEHSLLRRFATLDDVLDTLWTPRAPDEGDEARTGGVFDHLRAGRRKPGALELPAVAITWEKFHRTIVPHVLGMEARVPVHGAFYGLVTASDPEAPAIVQWDGLAGRPRNPVSWYFYHGGSPASLWGMTAGWAPVSAVFLSPHQWQEPEKFAHQGLHVFFALDGCRDTRDAGLALFPEILRSECHGIRSVIEAHSRSQRIEGREASNANGLAFQKQANSEPQITLRVRTRDGLASYTVDRWD